jgi:hypothetical protein
LPGFNVGGIGLAGQPSNVQESRRTYRWVFRTLGRGQGTFSRQELLHLRSASRPHIKIDRVTMDHNQEKARFAGKTDWDPCELSWYDIEQNPDISKGIYYWLETVSDQTTANVSHPSLYKKNAELTMLTGMNTISELWTMYGTWPEDVDWGQLDYQENQIALLKAKMCFDRAVRDCQNNAQVLGTQSRCGIPAINF